MIFVVDGSLFEAGGARDVDRIALLRNAFIHAHSVFVTDSRANFEMSRHFASWIASQAWPLREELEFLAEEARRVRASAATMGSEALWVSTPVDPSGSADFHAIDLPTAVRIANSAVHVLVEDALSDAAFIRRALPPNWRAKFAEWERAGQLSFEHGGGIDSIRRLVQTRAPNIEGSRDGVPYGHWCATRFVVFDRDCDETGTPSSSANALRQACMAGCLSERYHCLLRRSQENYLPKEAMLAIVENRCSGGDLERARQEIEARWMLSANHRHAMPLDEKFKNAFFLYAEAIEWSDAWFERDESCAEMTALAEKIAARL